MFTFVYKSLHVHKSTVSIQLLSFKLIQICNNHFDLTVLVFNSNSFWITNHVPRIDYKIKADDVNGSEKLKTMQNGEHWDRPVGPYQAADCDRLLLMTMVNDLMVADQLSFF